MQILAQLFHDLESAQRCSKEDQIGKGQTTRRLDLDDAWYDRLYDPAAGAG